jgi:putative ABC transport system permease protein
MDRIWQDTRYALRTLVKERTFAAAVVLTFALGIGTSTAIFSVCNAVLFRPLPYPQPNRLVMLWERMSRDGKLTPVAPANFVDWREENRSFERLAAVNPFLDLTLTGRGDAERVVAAAVSADLFPLLGTQMAIGRGFLTDDDRPGHDHVTVISDAFWRRHFAASNSVVGSQLVLNDTSYTIIGVLPPTFQFVAKAADFQGRNQFDVWVPLGLPPQRLQRGTHPLRVLAQLKSGVTLNQAQADLDLIAKNLERTYPANTDRGIEAVPLTEQIVSNVRTTLLTLFAAVGLVLLIACVNVANLMLSRATAREQETAVRLALGASRSRLGQQFVTESSVLALLGGVAGVAWGCVAALARHMTFDVPRAGTISIDLTALAFSAAVSLMTGLVFGCVPLTHRVSANESLRRSSHTVTGGHTRTRNALVVAQVALACVLLIGAGLMGRSLWRLLRVSPGFRTEHILTGELSVPSSRYRDVRQITALQRELLDRVQSVPDVRSAGIAAYLPLGGSDNSWSPTFEGRPPLPPGEYIKYRPVTPSYFDTLAIPLQEGRRFAETDREDAPAVVIINEAAARNYWPNGNAIGQRLQIDGPPWRTVVGVVGDVRHEGLDAEWKPELYLPYAQLPYPNRVMTLVVRTIGEPMNLTAAVRKAVSSTDSGLPLYRIETLEHIVDASLGQPRLRAILLAAFAIVALTLASIGLYGVMSCLVSQRTREFGIRAAVGATSQDLMGLVLERSLALVLVGLALGLLSAAGLQHFVRSLLFGVAPYDVLTFSAVPVLLVTVALVASYLPARKAAAIDPIDALRSE